MTDASGGGDRVVEVAKLTPADRKLLVKGVLASEDQDQEQFLTQLRARLDRQDNRFLDLTPVTLKPALTALWPA